MRALALAIACALVTVVRHASAAPTRQACAAAYEDAQKSQKHGELTRAREALRTCLAPECSPVLRRDCAGWLDELSVRMPSIVVEIDDGGTTTTGRRVLVDGVERPEAAAGRAIELDPGPHVVRGESSAGGASIDLIVREGEKVRPVRIELAKPPVRVAPPEAPAPVLAPGLSKPGGAAAVVGTVALGGFVTFGLLGKTSKSDLDDCRPRCSDERVSDVRSKFIVADVLLGVGVFAFATAAYFLFLRSPAGTGRF